MCVHACRHIHVCIYVVHTCACVCMSAQVGIHVCVHAGIRTCVCACMLYTCTSVQVGKRVHVHVCAARYAMCVRMCKCVLHVCTHSVCTRLACHSAQRPQRPLSQGWL